MLDVDRDAIGLCLGRPRDGVVARAMLNDLGRCEEEPRRGPLDSVEREGHEDPCTAGERSRVQTDQTGSAGVARKHSERRHNDKVNVGCLLGVGDIANV